LGKQMQPKINRTGNANLKSLVILLLFSTRLTVTLLVSPSFSNLGLYCSQRITPPPCEHLSLVQSWTWWTPARRRRSFWTATRRQRSIPSGCWGALRFPPIRPSWPMPRTPQVPYRPYAFPHFYFCCGQGEFPVLSAQQKLATACGSTR